MNSTLPKRFIRRNLANLITLGRIPLCFASFTCAILVLQQTNADPTYGFWGIILLILTALTDYFDGLVARKLNAISKIGPLADQMMDKMVYCIIFPTLAVGVMNVEREQNMPHVILALALCVTLLVRDHWVNFLRIIADRHQADSGVKKIGKLRTLWALPTACVMYAYCFSRGQLEDLYYFNALVVWVRHHDAHLFLIVLEISLFIINFVSAISYTKLYGPYLLDEICEEDQEMRRKILYIFPNLLTLMNAIMGISAMFLAYHQHYHLSFVLLMAATIFDKLDGAAARKLGLIDPIIPGKKVITPGMILDDIADLISFCIAPATIAYTYLQGEAYAPYLIIYAVLGLARLTYFTIDRNPTPGYFKGLPSPAAALIVGGMVHIVVGIDPENTFMGPWLLGGFVVIGLLMNAYFISYVHFGQIMSRSKGLSSFVFTIMLLSMFSVNFLGWIAVVLMFFYLISPSYIKPSKT